MKRISPITARSRKQPVRLIEALEGRAYLAGVVFGAPQNLSASSAGIAPVYANLDKIFSTTHADLIVASAASGSVPNSVSVLPGNGDGTFGAAHTVPLGFSPLTIIDGVLGTNGKTDIVVGSTNSSTVGVILQASDGTLSETDYAATGLADTQSVAVNDFNGDGHPDIAVASDDASTGSNIAIFLNNGDGTFTLHQVLSVPHAHLSSLVDFTAGSRVDLAVTDQDNNAVTTLLNDGAGNFSLGTDYSVGTQPVTIKSGKFNLNNDNNDDLVTANLTGGNVSVLLGNGDGSFKPTAVNTTLAGLPSGGGPLKVRVSNLTNSGKPDLLALLPAGSSGDSEVLLGQGDGTFHVGNIISTGGATRNAIAGGDLNGDGLTDLVLVDKTQVTALLNETNQDTGAPTAAMAFTQPAQTQGASTIEFNVTYTDARQIDTTTLGNGNLTVTHNGSTVPATLVSTNLPNAASVTVTYSIPAPSGALSAADEGTYTVTATSNTAQAVKNANAIPLTGGTVGTFTVPATSPTLLATFTPRINLKTGKHVKVSLSKFTWAASLSGNYFLVADVGTTNLSATSPLTGKLPAAVIAGAKNKGPLFVTITNSSGQTVKGKVTITLYASTNQSLPGGSNLAVSSSPVTVAPPFVDLDNLWNGTLPTIVPGKKVSLLIPVKNNGNVAAKKTVTITVQASTSGTTAGATTLATPVVHVSTQPGKTQKLAVHFTMPTLASGTYHLLITVGSLSNDTNVSDKTVVSGGTFTV